MEMAATFRPALRRPLRVNRVVLTYADDFRSTLMNGHQQINPVGPVGATNRHLRAASRIEWGRSRAAPLVRDGEMVPKVPTPDI
jgi:hypothetical protein